MLSRMCLAALATAAMATSAHGQGPPGPGGGETVSSRARPGYDPLGVRVGAFTLLPSLTTDLAYDDNLYATNSPKISDEFVSVRPSLSARSNWARHRLGIDLDAEFRRYAETKTENSEQYSASANGQLDITRDSFVTARALIARRLEPRGTTDTTIIGAEPIAYRELRGELAASQQIGRIQVQLSGFANDFRYDRVKFNNTDISLNFRDYASVSGTLRLSYALGPGLALFANGSLNKATYEAVNNDGRDSHGYDVLAGVTFGLTSLIYGQIGVGYLHQSFKDPIYPSAGGLDFNASLNWNPTRLLSVRATADRSVQRSPVVGSAGIIYTTTRAEADYELLRNLILNGGIAYTRSTFQDIGDRTDNRVSLQGGARYLVSRIVTLGLSATHDRQRASGTGGREFDDTAIRLSITLRR